MLFVECLGIPTWIFSESFISFWLDLAEILLIEKNVYFYLLFELSWNTQLNISWIFCKYWTLFGSGKKCYLVSFFLFLFFLFFFKSYLDTNRKSSWKFHKYRNFFGWDNDNTYFLLLFIFVWIVLGCPHKDFQNVSQWLDFILQIKLFFFVFFDLFNSFLDTHRKISWKFLKDKTWFGWDIFNDLF